MFAIAAVVLAGVTVSMIGCGSGSGSQPPPVTIQKADGYYNVTLDYANTSHREMGRQYALAINNAMPTYAQTVDDALAIQAAYLQSAGVSFTQVVARAKTLFNSPNFYADYKDEIEGMQEVFNYDVDNPGDGKLSKNELLVFQVFPDVMRAMSCSASAAFGSASVSGKTILGRNLDWISKLNPNAGALHSLTAFKNGNKTVANFGMLGQLSGATIFNTSRVFGAVLDGETGVEYPTDLTGRRSYMFDLRYALENFTTLNDVSNFMRAADHLYAYNHLIFLADESTAGAVENQVNNRPPTSGNRALRTDASPLQTMPPGQGWGILGAFATVNDYRLVNNYFTGEQYNTSRWTSFKSKYALVPAGQKIDINSMKAIAGYPGPDSSGIMDKGAIFVSEPSNELTPGSTFLAYPAPGAVGLVPSYTTIQSILIDMGTMELWAHFVPPVDPKAPPKTPTYRKVPNPIY